MGMISCPRAALLPISANKVEKQGLWTQEVSGNLLMWTPGQKVGSINVVLVMHHSVDHNHSNNGILKITRPLNKAPSSYPGSTKEKLLHLSFPNFHVETWTFVQRSPLSVCLNLFLCCYHPENILWILRASELTKTRVWFLNGVPSSIHLPIM